MSFHLCIDCRLIEAAGIGTYLKLSLAELVEKGDFVLTLLGRPDDLLYLKKWSPSVCPMKSAIYSVAEQFEYLFAIPPCDLFWSPHFNVPLFPIKAKQRITTIHDVYHLAHWDYLTLSQKVYAKVVYNAAFMLSDWVVTVSEFSKSEILKYASVKPRRLMVVSNPFQFEAIQIETEKKGFILAVGNLKSHKNLRRLIAAYALLQPQEKLTIVGKREGLITVDKNLLQEVENDPYLKHHVNFLGYVSEMRLKELYATAQLFVFPSTYEGFGYPPLEAMASNCPVAAAYAAAIPEVCQEAVEYFDPYSIESIAQSMHTVLNNSERREELIGKGRELIKKKRDANYKIVEVIDACCRCS